MKFTLKNVGKINNASIELQGITVVAGENNTGKSTIGKMLYCVFDSFHKINEQTLIERRDTIVRLLSGYYLEHGEWKSRMIDWSAFANLCIEKREYYKEDPKAVAAQLREFYLQVDKSFGAHLTVSSFSQLAERICSSLQITDTDIRTAILRKRLNAEFGMKVGHLNSVEENSEICLQVKQNKINFSVKQNSEVAIENYMNLVKEISYIDDPFVLDELSAGWRWFWTGEYDHRSNLLNKLMKGKRESDFGAVDELIVNQKLNRIYTAIQGVCDGELIATENSGSYVYHSEHLNGELDLSNLSTGIKSFVILRTLLKNGSIDENGIIVMDEPEIHLHPEWQLRFAELIVLIQKEFNANILLNTHSPYFLNAIQVFSRKYNISDKCRYYLTKETNDKINVQDVTNSTELIYEKLARPLQVLENMEYQYGETDR